MAHSQRYLEYLKSPAWKAKRARILRRSAGKCEECGTAAATQVHHLTYQRLGQELDSDLQALCRHCHALADAVRESNSAASAAAYDRAFETYATKRWGEDAFYYYDSEQMEDEFDRWLERKEYGSW